LRKINWYFDFLSPFAYLQLKQLNNLPNGVSISYKPILFPGLLQHHETKGPVQIPRKRIYTYRYCIWLARQLEISFHMPPNHPFPPLAPLRLAIALNNDGDAIKTIFDHIWRDGHDVGDPNGWAHLMNKLGVEDAHSLINDQKVKDQLKENTEHAVELGLFGVPSALIDDQLFWGQDSTPMLLAYLDDPEMFKDTEMARVKDLPSGI
jgi:2-hydroxychromene-2-carboxylate isomerase